MVVGAGARIHQPEAPAEIVRQRQDDGVPIRVPVFEAPPGSVDEVLANGLLARLVEPYEDVRPGAFDARPQGAKPTDAEVAGRDANQMRGVAEVDREERQRVLVPVMAQQRIAMLARLILLRIRLLRHMSAVRMLAAVAPRPVSTRWKIPRSISTA